MHSQSNTLLVFAKTISFVQIILLAAIFGFFYAYACSAMWGLDLVGGAVAVEAMNGINTEVRNGIFAPAFFGPLPMGIAAALMLWFAGAKTPAKWFAVALLIYFLGAFLVTMLGAVPMNRELLATEIPTDPQAAMQLWQGYSEPWQQINWIRTGFSGLAMLLSVVGIYRLGQMNIKVS